MSKNEDKELFPSLWDALSSLRLTIALLIILSVASIFGTVIPQNASPEEYLQVYKITTYKILRILGFLDMYHAGWFIFLLALLCLNLIACSLKRFRTTLKFFTPELRLDDGQWKTHSPGQKFAQNGLPAQVLPGIRETLSRGFSPPRVVEASPAFHLFAEKGMFSRLGVYFIHLSVLVILGGSLIGSFYGFRGNVNIMEGQEADQIILRNGEHIHLPGFNVSLEKFSVSFYPTGAPKEFKSILTIREGGRKVLTEPILVNHPLTYKRISFYQSTYGIAGVERVILNIKDRESGKELSLPAMMGNRTEVPGALSAFTLSHFLPDLQGMGPAFQVIFSEPNQPQQKFLILQNHPEFEEKRPGRYRFMIKEIEPKYYSGLQVTKDPGVWVVWAGCFIMIAGFYMTFFMSHRRVWIRLTEKGAETFIEIAGSSHRDRTGFEKEFQKIVQALNDPPMGLKEVKESEGHS